MKYLLGIDLGTSSVKALLLDKNGKIKGLSQESYSIDIPEEGYAEQSPEMWWEKTCLVIRNLLSKTAINPKEIDGIGLTGQMHGLVVVDGDGIPLRRCIIWSDQRTKKQVNYINNTFGKQALGKLTLNPIATGFYCASILWIKENEPDIYKKIHKAILPKDYIRLKLTGNIGTEITDASSTLLFDTAKLKWSDEMVSRLDINKDILPNCSTPCTIAGSINPESALSTGLCIGIPVVFGAGDQPTQALGNGIIEPGTVSVTIGTGGQVFTPVNTPIFDPLLRTHTFCHAIPNTWNIMGATLSAGLSMQWLQKILGLESFDEMSTFADTIKPGSEGIIFLPYLTGERTPHMDPNATGMFYGLTLKHNKANLIRAVMEGVIFSLKDCLDIFYSLNLKTNKIIASGGGAKSTTWKQIIADVFGYDIYTSSATEQASVGATILAGLGVGWYTSADQACKSLVSLTNEVIRPNPANSKIYEKRLETYRKLYSSLKDINHQ